VPPDEPAMAAAARGMGRWGWARVWRGRGLGNWDD